jgi:hypothetical protein
VIGVTSLPSFTPGTHWTGGCVDLRAGLDTEAGGKILCLCRGNARNVNVMTAPEALWGSKVAMKELPRQSWLVRSDMSEESITQTKTNENVYKSRVN